MYDLNINRKLLLIAVTLLTPFQLNASNVGFLKYAVITDFTESDILKLQKEYTQVLKNNKPGDRHNWFNAETGNRGEITVIKQYKQKDSICKRLKLRNQSKKQSAVSYFNFCSIDNQWKVVN
ncbi:MAG: hypothetical protein DIZ80_08475 [endosymbiont of Galathealinum brachiosum]|uniref:Surface antigen domain-containing protein n=1 Tax=endosymbiont of Galathealinum brachiosum TaxID=2200906 RepID=A0A370DDU2_9GAMM|nr:MAG: hypothetical protein DIZ80_08475 [endosymbiont of Galathealinum brachiosum]